MYKIRGDMMKAVSYCRVSTNEEDQLNSLKNQIEHYTRLFEDEKYEKTNTGIYYKKDGTSIILDTGIFADEGISGTKRKNRKAFNYMIKCAKRKDFDVIYCKNVQRFARNVEDGSGVLKQLKQYGVKVIFEEGNLDSSNPQHELVINLLLSMAQSESQSKSAAVKFGIRKAQEHGKWTSNKPLGYDRVDGYLQVNSEEAKIIKTIYGMYVNRRYGHNKIAKTLNQTVSNPSGKQWYAQHVKDVLLNPLYKGIQTLHKSENMDVNIKVIEQIPEDEWITTENRNLQIIDDDLWQKAQDIYLTKKEKYTVKRVKDVSNNLFSTIVFCDNCGGIMRRKRKRTKKNGKMINLNAYEWVCQTNHNLGKEYCKFRNYVDEDVLLDFAKNMILGYREKKELLDRNFNIYLYTHFDDSNISDIIDKIEKSIFELKVQRQNRLGLFDKGILNTDELREYIDTEYRPKEKKLFEQKLKYTNASKELERIKRQYKEFQKELNNIDVDNLTNADIKKVFSGIYVGTYKSFIPSNFIYKFDDEEEEYSFKHDNLNRLQYTWVNKTHKTFKHISCELNFMNEPEMDLFQEMAEKDWQKNITDGEIILPDYNNVIGISDNRNEDNLEYVSNRVMQQVKKLKG
jgi:DNA invertase Pin-like site-specific DNA recombinase